MKYTPANTPWTDKRIEQLKKLWAEGLSASQIAAEMFGDPTKRNSVIGKINREGLSGRNKFPAKSREGIKKPPEKLKDKHNGNPWAWRGLPKKLTQPKPLPVLAPPDLSHAVSIFEHKEGQCRWIVVEAVPNIHDLQMCGCSIYKRNYCEFHFYLSYSKRAA